MSLRPRPYYTRLLMRSRYDPITSKASVFLLPYCLHSRIDIFENKMPLGETGRLKVSLNPITEIKVSNLVKMDLPTLTKHQAIGDSNLFWIDGICFFPIGYESEELTLSESKGVLFLDTVFYAECPERIEYSKIREFNIYVNDMTGHATFEGLIGWVKTHG